MVYHRQLQPLSCNNFQWNTICKNTESLSCTSKANTIQHINHTSDFKNEKLYQNATRGSQCKLSVGTLRNVTSPHMASEKQDFTSGCLTHAV